MAKPRIKIPKTISAGEVFTVKTLISHRMESGHRKDERGETVPRFIINQFTCTYNGEQVFSCDMQTGVAANPYFAFTVKVHEAGTFKFTWVDDEGSIIEAERAVALS